MPEGSGGHGPESEKVNTHVMNQGIEPTAQHKVQDALGKPATRRTILGALAAGGLGLTGFKVAEKGSPTVHTENKQSLPQLTPTQEAPAHPQYELDTAAGLVDEDTYKELFSHNARFAQFDQDRGWITSDKPTIEKMILSPVNGKLIVRHGPHFGDNYDEVDWNEYSQSNPSHEVFTTNIVGDQYQSESGQGQIHVDGSEGFNGIWPAIIEKTHTEDNKLRYRFSTIYGENIVEGEEPDCVSANFASADTNL